MASGLTRTEVSLWPSRPSGFPGWAPLTPRSSAAASEAGPGPVRQPPRPQADSRTTCRTGAQVSIGKAGRWGREDEVADGEGWANRHQRSLMGCLCALPRRLLKVAPCSPPNPFPSWSSFRTQAAQDLAVPFRTLGLRK